MFLQPELKISNPECLVETVISCAQTRDEWLACAAEMREGGGMRNVIEYNVWIGEMGGGGRI